ncbi:MAG: hypothetical protein MUE72_02120, partial [Chitinophagaceae bacterium]|nr:hypothetical protein [Chitinophagaceae bacterium]
MESSTDYVDISGAMDLVKKSSIFYAPIFEAITNSFEAISIKKYSEGETPIINVNFYFNGMFDTVRDFDKIEIIDNGLGFDEESYKRYKKLFDKSKNLKNRGSGRLQFLHRFKKVSIESTYFKENKPFTRNFYSDEKNLTVDATEKEIISDNKIYSGTKITMSDFKFDKNEKISFDSLSITEVQNELKKNFFLKLYLEEEKKLLVPQITITFFKNDTLEGQEKVNPNSIIQPESIGEIKVFYERVNGVELDEVEW